MRHLKLLFWLSAWGVWLWLGFGLYRELPRKLGPVVCKLPLIESERADGFLGDERTVVSTLDKFDNQAVRYRFWDSATGRLMSQQDGPVDEDRGFSRWDTLRHGYAIGVRPERERIGESDNRYEAINLRTGEWHSLFPTTWSTYEGAFCDERPWIYANGPEGEVTKHVVVDLSTCNRVFEWQSPQVDPSYRLDVTASGWIPGTTKLFLSYWITSHGFKPTEAHFLEVWEISSGERLSRLKLPGVYTHVSAPASNGRVVVGQVSSFEIFNVLSGKTVLSNRTTSEAYVSNEDLDIGLARGLSLSPDGRCLVLVNGVWDIDNRRALWRPREELEALVNTHATTAFFVLENWNQWLFPARAIPTLPDTLAIRDFATGAVRYRTSLDHPPWSAFCADGQMAVTPDGVVYRMPPRVNFPLLALCQAILALPLLLLWSTLWYRRLRAARRRRQAVPPVTA